MSLENIDRDTVMANLRHFLGNDPVRRSTDVTAIGHLFDDTPVDPKRPPIGNGPKDRMVVTRNRRCRGSYSISEITYPTELDGAGNVMRAFAHLLVPYENPRPSMAVLALHSSGYNYAADEVVGETPHWNHQAWDMEYGRDLVKRGFVVIAPDIPGQGDRLARYNTTYYGDGAVPVVYGARDCRNDKIYKGERGFNYSNMLKTACDNTKAIDALFGATKDVEGFNGSELTTIIAIGHSWGGTNALIAGVFDHRIKIIIESCGIEYRGWNNETFQGDNYNPRYRVDFEGNWANVSRASPYCSWGYLLSSLRDRRLFMNDRAGEAQRAYEEAKGFFSISGEIKFFCSQAHCFPTCLKSEAFHFIDGSEQR